MNKWYIAVVAGVLICAGLWFLNHKIDQSSAMTEAFELAQEEHRSWLESEAEILLGTAEIPMKDFERYQTDWDTPPDFSPAAKDLVETAIQWYRKNRSKPSKDEVKSWAEKALGCRISKFFGSVMEAFRTNVTWLLVFDDREEFSDRFEPHLSGYIALRDRLEDEKDPGKEDRLLNYIFESLEVQ